MFQQIITIIVLHQQRTFFCSVKLFSLLVNIIKKFTSPNIFIKKCFHNGNGSQKKGVHTSKWQWVVGSQGIKANNVRN